MSLAVAERENAAQRSSGANLDFEFGWTSEPLELHATDSERAGRAYRPALSVYLNVRMARNTAPSARILVPLLGHAAASVSSRRTRLTTNQPPLVGSVL